MTAAAPYVCRQFVEDVTAYLEGVLPDETSILVELHLADCPYCREYLRQMQVTVAKTRSVTEHDVATMPAELRDRLMEAFRDDRGRPA
jgi:predicted anti-sigma-YlaC factor YlaD